MIFVCVYNIYNVTVVKLNYSFLSTDMLSIRLIEPKMGSNLCQFEFQLNPSTCWFTFTKIEHVFNS